MRLISPNLIPLSIQSPNYFFILTTLFLLSIIFWLPIRKWIMCVATYRQKINYTCLLQKSITKKREFFFSNSYNYQFQIYYLHFYLLLLMLPFQMPVLKHLLKLWSFCHIITCLLHIIQIYHLLKVLWL